MKLTIYCAASMGNHPIYREKAIELAKWMTQNNLDLVYGGGKVGLMGFLQIPFLKTMEKPLVLFQPF